MGDSSSGDGKKWSDSAKVVEFMHSLSGGCFLPFLVIGRYKFRNIVQSLESAFHV